MLLLVGNGTEAESSFFVDVKVKRLDYREDEGLLGLFGSWNTKSTELLNLIYLIIYLNNFTCTKEKIFLIALLLLRKQQEWNLHNPELLP